VSWTGPCRRFSSRSASSSSTPCRDPDLSSVVLWLPILATLVLAPGCCAPHPAESPECMNTARTASAEPPAVPRHSRGGRRGHRHVEPAGTRVLLDRSDLGDPTRVRSALENRAARMPGELPPPTSTPMTRAPRHSTFRSSSSTPCRAREGVVTQRRARAGHLVGGDRCPHSAPTHEHARSARPWTTAVATAARVG